LNQKEIEQMDYDCEKLRGIAHVTLEYLHHKGGVKKQIGFDCDGCYDCGVAIEDKPGSWSFKWNNCIFPKR